MMDIYFWRQLFILTNILLTSFAGGIMIAYPSVLNPAITSPNSTDITTTRDHASWITAVNGLGGLLSSFIMPPVLQMMGRKVCTLVKGLCLLTGFLIFPFAKGIAELYAARFIQGIFTGGVFIHVMTVSEYSDPCRRGYFVVLMKVAVASGVLCCHVLNSYLTWRQIALFASVYPLIANIMILFWPESPSYLALKGKFAACEKSFIWLHGNSENSRKHLNILIDAQRQKVMTKNVNSNRFVKLIDTFSRNDFQKLLLLTSVLTMSIDFCGRYFYMACIIQVISEIINSKASAMYFTLGGDLLVLVAVSMSSVVIRHVNRRTLIFTSGALSVILMLLISLMTYLKSIYTLAPYIMWLIAAMVIVQSFIANIGLIPVAFVIIGEIFPLEDKGLGSFASTFVFTLLYAVVLKLAPVLMENTKLYGTYGLFGLVLSVCLTILYRIVPETKDKTLLEIEEELKHKSKINQKQGSKSTR